MHSSPGIGDGSVSQERPPLSRYDPRYGPLITSAGHRISPKDVDKHPDAYQPRRYFTPLKKSKYYKDKYCPTPDYYLHLIESRKESQMIQQSMSPAGGDGYERPLTEDDYDDSYAQMEQYINYPSDDDDSGHPSYRPEYRPSTPVFSPGPSVCPSTASPGVRFPHPFPDTPTTPIKKRRITSQTRSPVTPTRRSTRIRKPSIKFLSMK